MNTQKDVFIACEFLNIKLVKLSIFTRLNPIEDLWRIIKQHVYSTNYNSLTDLITIVLDEFYKNIDNKTLFKDLLNEFM